MVLQAAVAIPVLSLYLLTPLIAVCLVLADDQTHIRTYIQMTYWCCSRGDNSILGRQ